MGDVAPLDTGNACEISDSLDHQTAKTLDPEQQEARALFHLSKSQPHLQEPKFYLQLHM